MRELEHRSVIVVWNTVLLRIGKRATWSKLNLQTHLRCLQRHFRIRIGETTEMQIACTIILLDLDIGKKSQSPLFLIFELQLVTMVEHHLVNRCPFECREHVILIMDEELIRWRHYIV